MSIGIFLYTKLSIETLDILTLVSLTTQPAMILNNLSVISNQSDIEERIVQRLHSNIGEAGRLNWRVRCRDLDQSCAGSDCEIQGRYKIHIQERIWSKSIEMGFVALGRKCLGAFLWKKRRRYDMINDERWLR